MRVRIRFLYDEGEIVETTRTSIRSAMRQLARHMYVDMVLNYLSGQALKVRSGTLRRSVRELYEERGDRIYAGVVFGVRYAKTHIGRKGTYTEITPKRARFLAIPTENARTPAGVSRYKSPRDIPNTFIRGGVIYQETPRGAVPMYILKRKVRIPKRIDPVEFLERAKKKLRELL